QVTGVFAGEKRGWGLIAGRRSSFIFGSMKTELLNPRLMLATAAAATLLAGCASPNPGYSDITGPPSAVSFTTATNPKQLIKWTEDPFIFRSLRSIDTYHFQVRDTGY